MNANLHKTVGLLKTLYDFSLCVCVPFLLALVTILHGL